MPKSLIKFWCKYLFAHKWWLLIFATSLLGARLTQYAIYPLFSKYVIEWIENPPVPDVFRYALPYLFMFAGIILIVHVGWFIRYRFERKIQEFAKMRISEDLHYYVNSQSISFYSKTEPGKIARNMDYITDGYYECLLEGAISFFMTFIVVIFAAIMLLQSSLVLATAFLIINLLSSIWALYAMPQVIKWSDKYADLHSEISGKLNDSLSNFITVKLFAGARHERAILRGARERLRRIGIRQELADSYFWIPASYVLDVADIVCYGLCIYMTARGTMPVANAVFSMMLYNSVSGTVWECLMKIPSMVKGYSSAKTAYRELVRPIEIADAPDASELVVRGGEIAIKNLSFRFPDASEYILKNLNLQIAPGEKVGIVGLSGNGKTTLARLVMRFYDPTKGQILIDGQDIRHVSQDSLRRNIAFVPQDETMFNRTLAQNIGYGRVGARTSQIHDAARLSNSFDFIDKTKRRFSTMVGTRGIKLSGGQRQRIAIARAFLKDAPILILDEATSALDSQSESVVQQSIKKLTRDRTCLIIAHRLSTLKYVDRIIVLQNGKIIEQGPHSKLIRNHGMYANLWQMQSCGFIGRQSGK